jgi:hypothetical protein
MNKQGLIEEINKIPLFVLRDSAVKNESNEWVEAEFFKGVTEEQSLVPLTFVGKHYQLVQFKDVFIPLIQNIEELDGDLTYFGGFAYLDVFPTDEKLKEGNDRIGMVAVNSVDKTSSVIVKFCIKHGDFKITLPKNIAGFKRMHVGKTIQVTENFLVMVDSVRKVWKTILTEFSKIKMDTIYAETVLNELEIKEKRLRKKIMEKVETTAGMTLWDFFLEMIYISEDKNYKSEVHRRKKIERICDGIFRWAVTCKLLNA